MFRYQLLIEYLGTNYKGWQIQKKNKTIQGIIKEKIRKILKEKIKSFRDDEIHHRNIAYDNGASKEGLYSIFDKIIKIGSKVAINISEKI